MNLTSMVPRADSGSDASHPNARVVQSGPLFVMTARRADATPEGRLMVPDFMQWEISMLPMVSGCTQYCVGRRASIGIMLSTGNKLLQCSEVGHARTDGKGRVTTSVF
jgi:hypothetical protein